GASEALVMLIKGRVGGELVALLRTVLRSRSVLPVHLKERAGHVGDAKFVALENASCFRDLLRIEPGEGLVPHTAQLDPLHPEFLRGNFAGATEVLRDLVVNYGHSER